MWRLSPRWRKPRQTFDPAANESQIELRIGRELDVHRRYTFILVLWIILNWIAWTNHWDPYPFILLNLALSFQSAYAAPILMISQNRQAKLNEPAITLISRSTCWRSRDHRILRLLRLL